MPEAATQRAASPTREGCRVPPERELLLEAALAPPEAAEAAWRRWRTHFGPPAFEEVDWPATRLFASIARRLADRGASDPWLGRMRGVARHMWVQSRLRRQELAPVLTALAKLPAPALLLKGEALIAAGSVPDDGSRIMGDSDLLVREEDLEAAGDRLGALGWKPAGERGQRTAKRHAYVYLSATGRELDLHRWLLPLPARVMPYELMASHAEVLRLGGVEVRVPHATELLFHVLIAGPRPMKGGPAPFLWVADAVHLLRQTRPGIDASRLVDHARRYEQVLAVREGLRYLVDRFATPVPAGLLADLSSVPVTPREARVHTRMATPRPYSASPRVLWHAALDDHQAQCEVLGTRPTVLSQARYLAHRAMHRGFCHAGRVVRRVASGRRADGAQ